MSETEVAAAAPVSNSTIVVDQFYVFFFVVELCLLSRLASHDKRNNHGA
jgi:hypothetical protein